MAPGSRPNPRAGWTTASTGRAAAPARAFVKRGIRILFLAALVLLLIYLSLYVFAANVLHKADPSLALRLAPTSSAPLVSALEDRITAGGRGAELRPLAERAIRREPLNTAAWRALGLIEASNGNVSLATRIISFANFLSRRDNATNLWLIEQHLQHNDLAGALEYYDYALRSSLGLREQLMPRLVAATAEPETIPPLADTLLRSPGWADDFFADLNNLAPDGKNLSELIRRLQIGGYNGSYEILRALPRRFVQLEQMDPASRIYTQLSGSKLFSEGVLAFAQGDPIVPFDWEFVADGNLEVVALSDGAQAGGVLLIRADSDQRQIVARRLLTLVPGDYALVTPAVTVRGPDSARLSWEFACHGNGKQLATAPLALTGSDQTVRFRVPAAGCAAQWLSLRLITGSDPAASEIEVPRPALRRLGG